MENETQNERGRITAEQALKMLQKENVDLTLDQAKNILDFMRKLASITVSNYLKQNRDDEKDSRPIRESKYRRTSRQRVFSKESRGSIT
ncbi:hypothetical protein ACRASX_02225 [Flavobacterium sp. TMP13]|uniref:hypothetical protein n=1 Tax=unclassified Flavobacterium TaxID=196869 RepID=UPI000832ECB7|nr:hypothetical protein [Flavobacterium sp. TAB 87]